MPPPALFGIENGAVNTAVNLLILFLVVIWLALVYRAYADAQRRIMDPMLVWCAALGALIFPFVGSIVYMLVRPPEYLEDMRERELEMQAAEARLYEITTGFCPHCDHPVDKDFLRCPSCLRKLKDPCPNCAKPLDPGWRLCPYCEAEVGSSSESTARRRRRRSETSDREALTET